MAKSKAQTLTLLQECVDTYDTVQAFLAGSFETKLNELSSAIDAGDDELEDSEMANAVEAMRAAGEALWGQVAAGTALCHKVLGRYAGSKNIEDIASNLGAFNDQLFDDTEAVEERGLTLFSSMTPDGGNAGDGTVVVLTTDPEGQDTDCAHPISELKVRCVKDGLIQGVFEDAESWLITGDATADRIWDEGSVGDAGAAYEYQFGEGTNEFGPDVLRVNSGGSMTTLSGTTTSIRNEVTNPDFEAGFAGSGSDTDKIPNWTITANPTNITEETTDPIKGDSSINFGSASASIMEQNLFSAKSRTPYVFGLLVETEDPNADITGDLIVRVRDDSTIHSTLTIDVSTLTDDTPVVQAQGFIMPDGIGENLRIEVEGAAWGGTGTRFVLVDNVFFGEMEQFDVGYSLAVVAGPNPFRYNDEFIASTTTADSGTIQRFMNRQFQRYLRHGVAATFWTDP